MNKIEREICKHPERFKSLFEGGWTKLHKYDKVIVQLHDSDFNWRNLNENVFMAKCYCDNVESWFTEIIARREFADNMYSLNDNRPNIVNVS